MFDDPEPRQARPPAGLRRPSLWVLAGFWLLFVALYTVRSAVLDPDNLLAGIPGRLITATAGALISLALMRILLFASGRSIVFQAALVLVLSAPAALLFSTVNAFTYAGLAPLTGQACLNGAPCTADYLRMVVIDYATNWTFIFVACGLLYLWLDTLAHAVKAERRASQEAQAARLAEIRALRYQVNPHFLFNCLNAVSTLIGRRSTREAQAMVGDLAAFIRSNLASEMQEESRLDDEVDIQRRYLGLEQRRFGDRLTVEFDIAPDTSHVRLPSLLLQPVIENAVKHGVARTASPVHIRVESRVRLDKGTRIVIRDDAVTSTSGSDGPPSHAGLGLGLRNIQDRLRLRYGDRASVSASLLSRGGFEVVIDLPPDPA